MKENRAINYCSLQEKKKCISITLFEAMGYYNFSASKTVDVDKQQKGSEFIRVILPSSV